MLVSKPRPPTPPTAAIGPPPPAASVAAAPRAPLGGGKGLRDAAPTASAALSADALDAKIAAELEGLDEGDEEAGELLSSGDLAQVDEDFESMLND